MSACLGGELSSFIPHNKWAYFILKIGDNWGNNFFSFCGAPNIFFWPQKPYFDLKNLTVGGTYKKVLGAPLNEKKWFYQ